MQPKKNSGKKSVRSMTSVALSQLNMLKGLRLTSHASRLAAFMLFAYLTGCAAPQQQVKRRYFWPPPPDIPKIEFIAAYMGQQDLPKSASQRFTESLVGETTSAKLDRPWGIASDGEGKVYVASTSAAEVMLFDFKNNKVSPLEVEGLFRAPIGLELDGTGNLYVSDSMKKRVFVFDKDLKPLRTIGDDNTLNRPVGMAINDGLNRLYVVNSQNHNIAVFDLKTGNHLFNIGKRGDSDGTFNYLTDVDIDSKGNLVVADSMNARVQILDKDGVFIRKFGNRGDGLTDFSLIKGIAVDKQDRIYVTDGRADRMAIFSHEGEALLVVGAATAIGKSRKLNPGGFFLPQDVMIDKNGTVYVVDSMNARFQVFQVVDEEWLKKNPIEK